MAFDALKASVARILAPVETKSAVASVDTWGLDAFLAPNTTAGIAVTPEKAMTVPAVNAAVALVAGTFATMPAKLYRRVEASKEVADDHPAYRYLHRRANPWTTAEKLRGQLTLDAMLYGNGYAVATRNGEGRVIELNRVDPNAVSVEVSAYGEPSYTIVTGAGREKKSFRDVLHLPARVSFDGITGRAPIALARNAIALAIIMEEHGLKLFKEGARPSAVVSYPSEATKPNPKLDSQSARNALTSATRAGLAGVDNSGKLGVLFDDGKIETLSFSSVDAQFLELRRLAVDEIARAFRVPPSMLFELGRATWGNAEEMGQSFVTYTLLPWIEAWKDAYARVLLDEDEDDLEIEFIVDDLLRADTAARFAAYSQAIASRILNPNEVRALENRAPYDGGDEFLNPNTTTAAPKPPKEAA